MRPSSNADYKQYLSEINGSVERDAEHARQLHAAKSAGATELDAAIQEQRAAATSLKNLDASLGRIRPSINQLVARSGIVLDETTTAMEFAGVDQLERELQSLTAELRGAEQSWEWVEKARREQAGPLPVHNQPAPSEPSPSVPPNPASETPSRRNLIIVVGVFACILLVAILFLFL